MKKYKLVILSVILIVPFLVIAGLETKYEAATDATAEVLFSPNTKSQTKIQAGSVRADYSGTIKFYDKGGAGKVTPTANATNGATVISLSNTAYGLTNSDMVVYYHSVADVSDYRTISASTPSNVTLSSGISSAGVYGDAVYELKQVGQVDIVTTSAAASTLAEDIVVTTDEDSPLRILLDIGGGANSNATLNVTVEK